MLARYCNSRVQLIELLSTASRSTFIASGRGKLLRQAKAEEGSVYIPAGAMLKGVLLNGLDMPTGQGARKDPAPGETASHGAE